MGHRATYRSTLTYALAIAGGEVELAKTLGVMVPQLENWLNGVDDIPDRVFLAAVDVIVQSSPEALSRSRLLLDKFSKSISPE